jgi:beta-lactamase regulating signal transducer with metallopeptidase domain
MEIPLWFSNLVFWSVQVALLVLAAGLLPRALKLRQPQVLLAYWRALLAISLLLPFIQPWHRPQSIAPIVIATDFVSVPLPPLSAATAPHWHLPSLQTIAPIVGIVILVGIALRSAILALGLLKLCRLRQASSPIPSSAEFRSVLEPIRTLVAVSAEFRLSSQVDSPVTFGFVAPLVLLPERFASLAPHSQSAIACHELLHVRRHDWAHHIGEEFLRALFWFHPAIVWLISRTRLAREQIVDLEVVRLTEARKPYLEALLEFTNGHAPFTPIPAPPFLAERQLVERIALMVKEVRMSRRRLIASLTVISCCLALVIALAAVTFPLKAAPRPARAALTGITQQHLDAAAPIVDRIEIKHHDFGSAVLNDVVVNKEQARLNQLPDRLTVETPYNQAKVDAMRKVLEDFWSERGLTVEVHFILLPSPRSPHYVILQLDVYKQTILPGRLEGGVSGGISGGIEQGISRGISDEISKEISKGIAGGISGGISGAIRTHASQDEPSVDYSTIWLDTVKRGPMLRQVRGLGILVRAEGSSNLVARVTLPASMTADLKPGLPAAVATQKGPLAKGHVSSISPSTSGDTRTADVVLDAVPEGTSAGLSVDTSIDIEKLDNILYIHVPLQNGSRALPNSAASLYKIVNDGKEAVRVTVKLGRTSVNTIEVLDGLQAGDKIILSDMSSVANADRIHVTDEQHVRKQ